jgi:hypothetical protein
MPLPTAPGIARGCCMCGSVRFAARMPSRFCCHCHCESCRRSHTAGFVTWIGFASSQVSVESGAGDLVAYLSSPGSSRSFCRKCGSKLFYESDKWPGETHVALAAFDDPVDRSPDRHVFFDEHVEWIPWPGTAEP